MNDVTHVSEAEFDEITKLMAAARRCRELSHMPGLSLAKKLALLNKCNEFAAKARAIGKAKP